MYHNNFCGCCNQLPPAPATCQTLTNVVNSCNVQEYPHIINYHTHHNNSLIKRHVTVPQYTHSEGYQVFEEFGEYPQPTPYPASMYQMPYQAPMYQTPYQAPGAQSYPYQQMSEQFAGYQPQQSYEQYQPMQQSYEQYEHKPSSCGFDCGCHKFKK